MILGSIDGVNFFDLNTMIKVSNTAGWAYKVVDVPLTHMRVSTSSYGGTPFDVNVIDF